MATRTPKGNPNSQDGLRNSAGNGNARTDWVVFRSMNEFKFWVVIVTLIIFGMMLLSFMLVHQENRIKKLDALVLRMEEKEKKREKIRRDPIDPE